MKTIIFVALTSIFAAGCSGASTGSPAQNTAEAAPTICDTQTRANQLAAFKIANGALFTNFRHSDALAIAWLVSKKKLPESCLEAR